MTECVEKGYDTFIINNTCN